MRLSSTSSMEKRGIIKRTKSFWKFGKSSDNEILEGMSLWQHRDLVDVQKELAKRKPKMKKKVEEEIEVEIKPSKDRGSGGSSRSNDSDRTLLPVKVEEPIYVDEGIKIVENGKQVKVVKHVEHVGSADRVEMDRKSIDSDFENEFWDGTPTNVPDSFFDDDGLMLRVKTVNRKHILERYKDDDDEDQDQESIQSVQSTQSIQSIQSQQSESNNTTFEEDPYDCIVVDDQTHTDTKQRQKNKKQQSKKSTNKVAEIGKKLEKFAQKTSRQQKENIETTTNIVQRRQSLPRNSTRKISNPREHTFETFGHAEDHKRRSMPEHQINMMKKQYEVEASEQGRQIIPRTKLVKSNSLGTAQERDDAKYREAIENGHMYGPWYDLWGLDPSVQKHNSRNKNELRAAKPESIYGENF